MYFLYAQGVGDKMSEDNKYYLIKQKAVPEVLRKVIEAKRLLESGTSITIQ